MNSSSPAGVLLVLPILWMLAGMAGAQPGLRSLDTLDDNERPVPLPVDEAFPFFVSETGPGRFRITWTIAPDHYLYRHAFRFELQSGGAEQLEALPYEIPDGTAEVDQFFGRVEVYYGRVAVDLRPIPAAAGEKTLIIQFQGCAEWGFCYPPRRVAYPLL